MSKDKENAIRRRRQVRAKALKALRTCILRLEEKDTDVEQVTGWLKDEVKDPLQAMLIEEIASKEEE